MHASLSVRTISLALASFLLLGALPLQAAADILPGNPPVKYNVGFSALPAGLVVGGTWNGGTITSINAPLKAIAVSSTDASFKVRANGDSNVRYVELDKPRLLLDAPNDPQYPNQYAPQQVRLPDAWTQTIGNTQARICFVDSGVRDTHQDLGGARFLGGWDFIENDAIPDDDRGHGTFVVGIAAATVNNSIGIAGAANVAYYMAKVFAAVGSTDESIIAQAIVWCADNAQGKVVISMSLGGEAFSQLEQDAVQYAAGKGHLLIAAAGNQGCWNCVLYPGKFAEVVAVTCTDANQAICSFSSTGPEADLAAPGNNILSTCFETNTAYCSKSGTSASTPLVAGIAALYWGANPTQSATQVRARLEATARDLGSGGRDDAYGAGRIDAKCIFENATPCGPPPNDAFASAEPVALPLHKSVSTQYATTEAAEPQPCGQTGATTWYSWTAPAGGRVTASTAGSAFNTVLAAYTGPSFGALVNLACNDDTAGGLQSEIQFNATAGTTYYVQVGGQAAATGALELLISCAGCPANNVFANAQPINAVPYGGSQTTAGANVEAGEQSPCGVAGATVWYKWLAPGSGSVTLDTFNSAFDTVLAVYTGSTLTTLTNVGCNDNSDGTTQSKVVFAATVGTTYYVQAGGNLGAAGLLQLNLQCVQCTSIPVHDGFGNPKVVVASGYNDRTGTGSATRETGEPQPCGHIASTVWYALTPTADSTVYVDTYGSDFDTVVAAYTGSSLTNLGLVECNDDIAAGAEVRSQIAFDIHAGQTYYIQAGGFDGRTGTLQVNFLCISDCLPGTNNDMRQDAVTISALPFARTQSTLGYTTELAEPLAPTIIGATAWYKYTHPLVSVPRVVTIDTATSGFNTGLAVYVDGAYVPLGYNDDAPGAGSTSKVTFVALPGTTYMVQAGGHVNVWAESGLLALNAN